MKDTAILIPAYKPTQALVPLVEEIMQTGCPHIIVVDDGSGEGSQPIFEAVRAHAQVELLVHPVNQGKGAALKTGLEYVCDHYQDIRTVITADADGQHAPEDLLRLAEAAAAEPDTLYLGSRDLSAMPLKSKFGNTITQFVFSVFFGLSINDTQTGLRAIPRSFIPDCLEIPYARYELESEMLLLAKRRRVPIKELTIQTIYIDDNASSHFNPIVDSTKIYFVLFRYLFASLVSAGIDLLVFTLIFPILDNVLISIYGARAVSLVVNYLLLKHKVYYSTEKAMVTFPKYVLLVIVSGFVASWLIELFSSLWALPVVYAKMLAETLLYFVNFIINSTVVFMGRRRQS